MNAEQLAHVEQLCNALYQPVSVEQSQLAQQQLMNLQSSAEYIPQCQFILDNSKNSYALLVASNSLTKLITTHWNNFTTSQRIDIRNYILNYLAQYGPNLEPFVNTSLMQLVCRITKFGWFDDKQHRELIEEVTKFLQATVDHCILGLKILTLLVDELNIPTTGRTITQHRKTAVSFRDLGLLRVFQIGMTTLKQIQTHAIAGATPDQEVRLADHALDLVVQCLGYDFIGTNPDDSGEDVGTIQVPNTWRTYIQDPDTLTLLFDIYSTSTAPRSAKAMQAVIQLGSVRRSLFASDKDRSAFLLLLMSGIMEILRNQTGLNHQDNYHQFCRLLGRLKSNYQLSELVRLAGYEEWLETACDFTCKSFENWHWSTISLHYLLALWGRMVAAVPYVRQDLGPKGHGQKLERCVLRITASYIENMVDSVPKVLNEPSPLGPVANKFLRAGNGSGAAAAAAGGGGALGAMGGGPVDGGVYDDPLDDDSLIHDQVERLPILCRFQYEDIARLFNSIFDPLLQKYQDLLAIRRTEDSGRKAEVVEGQLTWLVYMIGASIGSQSITDSHGMGGGPSGQDGHEKLDGALCRRVFQLTQVIDYRLTTTQGQGRCDPRLEIALLYFFQSFRKLLVDSAYITGVGGGSGPGAGFFGAAAGAMGGGDSSGLPSSIIAHIASHTGSGSIEPTLRQRLLQSFFETLSLGDAASVTNVIISKLGNNLRYWAEEYDIIDRSLSLFLELAAGYSSGKLLMRLDTVNFLIKNHVPDHFPFLSNPHNARHRTTFHAALARLVYSTNGADDFLPTYDSFMEPLLQMLLKLNATSDMDLRLVEAKTALIGVFRDLRGIAQAVPNRRIYTLLFDALYPQHFPVLTRAAEVWYDAPEVTTPLLKFLVEFVTNKGQRLQFEQSSPNGILLFRETSKIVCAYGKRIAATTANANAAAGAAGGGAGGAAGVAGAGAGLGADGAGVGGVGGDSIDEGSLYKKKYKGISLVLSALLAAMSGSYVNFGVFALYEDKALDNAMECAIELSLGIPLNDVFSYPKLTKAYFAFYEIFFRYHLPSALALEPAIFAQIVNSLNEGLQMHDAQIAAQAAVTVDHLSSFYFHHVKRPNDTMTLLTRQLTFNPGMLNELMSTLFNQLLFGSNANLWSMSRPILSIYLANKQTLSSYKEQLLATQPPECKDRLMTAFDALVSDLQRSLDARFRDVFTQRLTQFRVNVRTFIAL